MSDQLGSKDEWTELPSGHLERIIARVPGLARNTPLPVAHVMIDEAFERLERERDCALAIVRWLDRMYPAFVSEARRATDT